MYYSYRYDSIHAYSLLFAPKRNTEKRRFPLPACYLAYCSVPGLSDIPPPMVSRVPGNTIPEYYMYSYFRDLGGPRTVHAKERCFLSVLTFLICFCAFLFSSRCHSGFVKKANANIRGFSGAVNVSNCLHIVT